MNIVLKSLAVAVVAMVPTLASGVTQKEMEEARTIATKAYLRYANDGSGYLDDLNPKTMAELESQLKAKEKENIVAFKSIPVPSDYKDWDKEKLLEYWAVTAFQDKGLLEKGRGGRIRARSQINKMTIASPTQEPEPVVPEEPKQETPVGEVVDNSVAATENPAVMMDELKEREEELAAQEEIYDAETVIDKEKNYTWVYIMVLCILVGVVIALVVYASNVLKKNGGNINSGKHDSGGENHAEKLEEYESLLRDKDAEILMLTKKLEKANRQNNELTGKIDALSAELAKFGSESRNQYLGGRKEETGRPAQRSIFLGRANAKGIFVRADRTLNVGNSVFVLHTSDGYSGTFKVADSQAAWSLALSNPKEYLETACNGYDLDDTAGASRIVTESAGTAMFEGGCWRVIRKARISYE